MSQERPKECNETVTLVGQPAQVGTPDTVDPETWEFYNAPRPIYGTEEWGGPFIRGVFWTAVDPDDQMADHMRQRNAELDAARIHFRSVEDHEGQVTEYGLYMAGRYGLDINELDRAEVERDYLSHQPDDDRVIVLEKERR